MMVKELKMAILGKTKGASILTQVMTKSRCLGQTKHEIRNHLSQRKLALSPPPPYF